MSRRTLIIVLVAVALVLGGVALWLRYAGSAAASQLVLAGDVRNDIWTVQAPAITYPTPDYTVGIPGSQTPTSTAGKRGGAPAPSQQPTVSGVIARMYVAQGDTVRAGQPVAQLDTTRLRLGVAQAKTAQSQARAQVRLLADALNTINDNQAKLATGRAQLAQGQAALNKGLAALNKAQAGFPAQRAATLQKRAGVVALRSQKSAELAALLQQPNPDATTVAQLRGQIAVLTANIRQIDAALAAAPGAFAKNRALLAAGQVKLATGRAQLASGASALAKAKRQLQTGKAVLTIIATAQSLGVTLAEDRVAQATIHAPVAGTVTEARNPGTVAMVGAPLVRIRPDAPTMIDTYLVPEQLALVRLGSKAIVNYDSNPDGPLTGRVTQIATRAEFPPTGFPTSIVHMTRTVKVTVTLDNGGWAPPGTPVDLIIPTANGR